jgi:tetratricopeptide (TPR) repeat protein
MHYFMAVMDFFDRFDPEKAIEAAELGKHIAAEIYENEPDNEGAWVWLCTFNQKQFLLAKDKVPYARALHDLYIRISDDLDGTNLTGVMHFCFDSAVDVAAPELLEPLQKQVLAEIEDVYSENPNSVYSIILSFGIHKRDDLHIPDNVCKSWLDIGMKHDDIYDQKVINSLGHTYQRAGEAYARPDYMEKAAHYFEYVMQHNPSGWPNYVYLGNCYASLAQMQPEQASEHLTKAVHTLKKGLEVDSSISLLGAASRVFFAAIQTGEELGVTWADLESLLSEAERTGDGYYWFAYKDLFRLYLHNRQKDRALAWLLRGWLLLGTYIPKEEIRSLLYTEAGLNEKTLDVIEKMLHYQPEINWKPLNDVVGLRTRALPELMLLFQNRIERKDRTRI